MRLADMINLPRTDTGVTRIGRSGSLPMRPAPKTNRRRDCRAAWVGNAFRLSTRPRCRHPHRHDDQRGKDDRRRRASSPLAKD